MIRDYAPETSLMPFERSPDGDALDNEANEKIFKAILNIFDKELPGFERYQQDIIDHHSRPLLNPFFYRGYSASNASQFLYDIHAEKPGALQKRQARLRCIMHYLPHLTSAQFLKGEMTGPPYWVSEREKMCQLFDLNVNLIIEAMHCVKPEFLKETNRRQDIELIKAGYLLKKAEGLFKTGKDDAAQKLFLDALQIFCECNSKREVMNALIHLLEWRNVRPSDSSEDLHKLFLDAKKLCLKYPADFDLYADLLFAMDAHCQKRSDFLLAHRLYQQTSEDLRALPGNYRAKLWYRQILAQYHAGGTDLAIISQINSALAYSLPLLGKKDRPVDTIDLEINAVRHSCAMLYRLTAQLLDHQILNFDSLTDDLDAETIAQYQFETESSKAVRYFDGYQYPSLAHDTQLTGPSLCAHLKAACTGYYKSSLKVLLENSNLNKDLEAQNLFVAIFDELVAFCRKTSNCAELEVLLDKDNVKRFNKYADFKSHLTAWRKILREMRKAVISH